MAAEDDLDPLLDLYRAVDEAARALAERHRERLQCGLGCHDCCVDGIAVLAIEAQRIRARHGDLLRTAQPHPEGACAFLDGDGGCRIYNDRPYVCRSEGLPLRFFDGPTEHRDICPLNDRGAALTSLAADDCWLLGPWEGQLAELQAASGTAGARVALRTLFGSSGRG